MQVDPVPSEALQEALAPLAPLFSTRYGPDALYEDGGTPEGEGALSTFGRAWLETCEERIGAALQRLWELSYEECGVPTAGDVMEAIITARALVSLASTTPREHKPEPLEAMHLAFARYHDAVRMACMV